MSAPLQILACKITAHLRSIMHGDDPISRQFVPSREEELIRPYESADPLNEASSSPVCRLLHRYRDRALLLVTDECAAYCRHCFRRRFTGSREGVITARALETALDYLRAHSEIEELLLSGGDPLTVADERLFAILSAARSVRGGLVLRVGTRVPVVMPERISCTLARGLSRHRPLWIALQVNHPLEITAQFRRAVDRLLEAGLPLLNQSVLLRGVNDDVDCLERLCRLLVAAGVRPYYLFQGDLAPGTAHLRVNIDRAVGLARELRTRLSELAMPRFAVDLPGGGGKIDLLAERPLRREADALVYAAADGREYRYPIEHPEEDPRAHA